MSVGRRQWCGRCDPQTRMVEVGEDRRPARCTACHPAIAPPLPETVSLADGEWMKDASEAIRRAAASGGEFTVADLRAEPYGISDPSSPALWGGALQAAARAGLIERIGHVASPVGSRRSGVIGVWRGRRAA